MGKIIAIAQQKGGVGKTTTAINLGAALQEKRKKVLLVDVDPQGALSAGLGVNPLTPQKTIYDVLRGKAELSEIIIKTESGLDVAPADLNLSASELELVGEAGREYFLKESLAEVEKSYDYILIDCPPALGLLTINALTAATHVLIPVQTEYFALRGMGLLFQTIERVQKRLNRRLEVLGILPTLFNAQTTHAREVLDNLRESYAKSVLSSVIPRTTKLADSTLGGETILRFAPDSPATEAYRNLAQEVEKYA